jgi:phosphate transport system permease protein
MVLLMARVALPLFSGAQVDLRTRFEQSELLPLPSETSKATPIPTDSIPKEAELIGTTPGLNGSDWLFAGSDEYFENGFLVRGDGVVSIFHLRDKTRIKEWPLFPPEDQAIRFRTHGNRHFSFLFPDGRCLGFQIEFAPTFDDQGQRSITSKITPYFSFNFDPDQLPLHWEILNQDEHLWVASLNELGQIFLTQQMEETDFFGEVTLEQQSYELEAPWDGGIIACDFSENGRYLLCAHQNQTIGLFALSDRAKLVDTYTQSPANIIHLEALYGRSSFLVQLTGGQQFSLTISEDTLVKTHDLPRLDSTSQFLRPSPRDKSFFTISDHQLVSLIHLTSAKMRLSFQSPSPLSALNIDDRQQHITGIGEDHTLWFWHLDNPHADVSLGTLWRRIWYEGYREPAYVWQSSSASDDFEPKMSLIPLLFGSLKGTFYSMLFALPLALLGAIYTSHLMHPRLKTIVKPLVELMAAIPSVIIGFLGALWLAPALENRLPGIFLAFLFIPLSGVLGGWVLRRFIKQRVWEKWEFLFIMPFLLLGFLLALSLGNLLQTWWFQGDFKLWMFQQLDIRIDQRNSIVIAFALGFAVIPVIFTIAEDALTNVPKHMIAASLGLGATMWQTVTRVILPIASPGIFAAIMIGLGRAVGETMIVLMATGNTPIMDMSMFNGMRTLAANIAVEIPEAPVGGSLYRVLFLSAMLLFLMTFTINTAAEFIRNRLRQKYGKL